MTILQNWSTCRPRLCDPFAAPELTGIALQGVVHGHRHKPDGVRVVTSRVSRVIGKIVTTESGTVYELGDPSEDYLDYLARQGRTFDADQPIRVILCP